MPFRASLKNLIRRTPAAPSLRERAASLRASISPSGYGSRPLPSPGSQEAKAAFAAACREHSIRTNPADGWPSLERDGGQIWTRDVLGKAMDAGEITPAEYARLYPLASERELLIETAGHDLNLGSLFALAYADEYPLRLPAAQTETAFADQVALAGAEGAVLAGSGVDHRDGTVSYADATGKVSRRPMAQWIGFNALQMHHRVGIEIARRRTIEANHLPADEHAGWEAKIRRDLRSDAVFALAFHPERAFKAAQDLPSGAELISAEVRASGDADLIALAPKWQAASDAYDQAIQEQIAVSDAAQPGPSDDQPHVEWARHVAEWREQTGIEAAEEASGEACRALGAIEDRIAELPAASLAGLRLKARVAQRCDDIGIEWPDGLGEGLARDLLAFGADGLAAENPAGGTLLLQLGRQFEAARKRETAAGEACNAAQDEADRHMPERLAALFFRASDHPLRLGKFLTHPDHLEGTEVTADDIAWMKRKPYVREVRRPVRPEDNLPADAHTVVEAHPWPEAQKRADEIVTVWDDWTAAKAAIGVQYGRPDLEEAADEAGEQTTDLVLRIAELPARTVAGFRVKLRALACYNPSFFYLNPPELPDEDQALSHSLWRDARDEVPPAIEPTATPTSAAEPSPVFVAIADSTRSAADEALSDARVSPDLRKAVEAHRDATLAMLLETDESNEASNARCGAVEQTGAALRAVPARSLADVRCKLAFLLPEILPDVNGSVPTAFLENIREDLDRLAQQLVPAPSGTSLVGQIDFASGSMEDLRALWDSANSVGDAAYAMAWTGRCHTGPAGEQHNAAGKLMQWLGEALADVADEARKEAQRRRPKTPNERETRLTILARPTIENGDPDEIAALAGELAAHAVAELAGR